MSTVRWIVRKKLRKDRSQTVLLIITAALATACLFTLFSLSEGYLSYYTQQTERFGMDAGETAWEGLLNVARLVGSFKDQPAVEEEESGSGGFLALLFGALGVPVSTVEEKKIDLLPEAADLFSARAALRNLPAMLLLTDLGGVLAVVCAVSLTFSVFRGRRRHFYATLLVGGASAPFIRRCAALEAFSVCTAGVPAGSALGAAGVVCLQTGAKAYMSRCGMVFPVILRATPSAVFAAALLVSLLMLLSSFRVCRKLSVRSAIRQTRGLLSAEIGIRTFTDSARKYRLLGLPHFIALRNLSNRLGKYCLIFLMIAFCMTELGVFLLSFTMIGNSGLSAYYAGQEEAALLMEACRFFFYAAAGSVQLFAMLATGFAMLSNAESNAGIYVLMRSAGASKRCLRATIRREGFYAAGIGVLLGAAGTFVFACYILSAYNDSNLDGVVHMEGAGPVFAAMAISALCYTVTVAAATEIACRRNRKTNMIKTLKELSYS